MMAEKRIKESIRDQRDSLAAKVEGLEDIKFPSSHSSSISEKSWLKIALLKGFQEELPEVDGD